jgi:hypothetical protein
LLHESKIVSGIVSALGATTDKELAASYLTVLLQLSYYKDSAQSMASDAVLFAILLRLFDVLAFNLGSSLVPLIIDLLWNIFRTVPAPRLLPDQVHFSFATIGSLFTSATLERSSMAMSLRSVAAVGRAAKDDDGSRCTGS